MKGKLFIILLAVSCFVWSCEEDILTGEITGSIYFHGTRIPVSGVSMELDAQKSTSNEVGGYRLTGPLGRYFLRAEKDGFEPHLSEVKIVQGTSYLDIYLTSSEHTTLVYGVVRGNHTANPRAGIQVMMLNPDESESEIWDKSDNEGNYQLEYVPRGERMIVVIFDGFIIFQELLILDDPEYSFDIYLPEPFSFVDERDGHVYDALKIGSQTWMVENLAWLPSVSGPLYGSKEDSYYYVLAYYGGSISEAVNTTNYWGYGVLYNWIAAKSSCPYGWNLPSDEEWQTLEIFLGMGTYDAYRDGGRLDGEIGRKMKSASGWINNGNGDNSSKFNVLPVGSRFDSGGFDTYGYRATFWTSTESSEVFAWSRGFGSNVHWVDRDRHDVRNGLSVRCIKSQ